MPPFWRGARVGQRTTSTLHGACCTTLELTEPKPPLSAVEATGAHHDHVRVLLLGLVDDHRGGVALALDDLGGHAFLGQRLLRVGELVKALLLLLGHEHRARAAELRQRLGHADDGDIGAVAAPAPQPDRGARCARWDPSYATRIFIVFSFTSFGRKRRAADFVLHPRRAGKGVGVFAAEATLKPGRASGLLAALASPAH